MFCNDKGQEIKLKGLYKNEPVFLFGGGKSITPRHIELSKKPGIITACLNEASHFVRPNFHIMMTGGTTSKAVLSDSNIMKFTPYLRRSKVIYEDRKERKRLRNYPNVVYYKYGVGGRIRDFFNPNFVLYHSIKGKYCNSSAFVALNILYKLGFRKIYLVGMDFYDRTHSCTHFYDRQYYDKASAKKISKVVNVLEKLKKAEHKFRIYNTNKKSKLDFFEYVNFDEAIERHAIKYEHDIYDMFNDTRGAWSWKHYNERIKLDELDENF